MTLTERDRQVIEMARSRLTTRQMAAGLHSSPRTVESHRANILEKMGVRNQDLRLALLTGEAHR